MNFTNETHLSNQQSTNLGEQNVEREFGYYITQKGSIEKIRIQIQVMSDKKIIYSSKGAILRVEEGHDILEKPEIYNNMDQIHNLSWSGQYGNKRKKDGKWIAFWNKKLIKNVGGYFKDGKKQGLWKDVFVNYSNYDTLFETGEYNDGIRIGKWNYINYDEKIGGGQYNKYGQKQGKWVDLDISFNEFKQITYNGEYNLNGLKVGGWDIIYCKSSETELKQIGGGQYDQEGNQKKIGKWVELDDMFDYYKFITYYGEFDMNGMKVGRWDIMHFIEYEQEFQQISSGGGSYDQEGNQKKIGKWVELDEQFSSIYYDCKQVTYKGEYNMNSMKVGKWDIMFNGDRDEEQEYEKMQIFKKYQGEYEYIFSGGGSYDQEGKQKKIGIWVDLDEGFKFDKQVTHNGEYNMNGIKVGRWDIMYCNPTNTEYKQIGGGLYDQEGSQKKIGKWVELNDEFHCDKYGSKLVTYDGEYNVQGQKVGIWVERDIKRNQKIGETNYSN